MMVKLPSFIAALRYRQLSQILAVVLVVAAFISGIFTYVALSQATPLNIGPDRILALINLDIVLILLVAVLILGQLYRVWVERRRGLVGAQLHSKLVLVFSLLAVSPAVIMGIFSAIFIHFGMESWFNERVRTALNESVAVAEGYLREHQKVIRGDIEAMSYDLRRDAEFLMINPDEFSAVVTQQAAARLLTEALVFAPDHTIIARTPLTLALELERVSQEDLDRARGGEIIIRNNESFDRVRALLYIGGSLDAFLYVGRLVDADVLNHMIKTQQAKNEYNLLESRRSDIEFSLTLMFLVVAFLLVLVAIWVGLSFVTRLAASVRSLMTAAEQVRMGNLKTRVNETISISKELTPLTRAFNRMTSQLEGQQQELLRANQELDQRRQVTESILSGVSVGVVAIDSNGLVTLHNPSAAEYLGTNDTVGKQLTDLLPEVEPLLKTAQSRQNEFYEEHMTVMRKGYVHTFIVRFVAESEGRYIVTFDDITELLQAQRKAAWGDVARRIAHEIKNPLTPIQLSAERLKRKYAPEIKTDPEIFAQCTDTIIRQVSGIGRMVDEFSHFARMPAAVFKMEDLSKLSQQMILLQSPAHPGIEFSLVTEQSVMVNCDGRLIAQAVTNLLQNAIDAIEGNDRPAPVPKGWIELRVKLEDQFVLIAVSDNGKGLPTEGRERLTEPYVTTRRKGTGLGLAIVKKIMEDHQGTLILADRPDGGSVVTLNFRRDL